MGLILYLYVIFSVIGVLAIILGQALLYHTVIKPIRRLSLSTERLADGELGTRVTTGSKTEIGSLYKAFNTMAERLQNHENELKQFNLDLEKKDKRKDLRT